ncbi:glycosyltransferase [Agrobacterium vitis]|uniref:glycosyltransferase family protein n=1 Tax=Rhizobium/Agrobacterium group TaxID=227290 RepID=UPI0013251B9F|nr:MULTISPECIES: glycosyltransferase [Rhizobium/Agrobacterium group]MCF1496399.1 glycosyltransferase [Allorhizobium ampelinum]MVA49047.1 glycosyltransferase [Agrobacterium vitis]
MKIVIYSTDTDTRNFYIIKSIQSALLGDSRVKHAVIVDTGDLVKHCRTNSVDLLLAVGGAGLLVEPVRRAISYVFSSVLWTTEDPFELKRNIDAAKLFDIVFTNEEMAVSSYKGKAFHMPLAASGRYHDFKPLESNKLRSDLFFVGTAWPERVKLLNDLNAALPRGLRKKIGLSGNPHLPGHHLGDLDLLTDFRLSAREFASFANHSAVTLTIDRSFSAKENSAIASMTPPPRLFEMAAAGSAQVYLTAKEDIERYFDAGKELIVVRTIEEAAEEIRNLASNHDLRMSIATAAYQRAKRDHMYENRVSKIIDLVQARQSKPKLLHRHAPRRILIVTHNVAGRPPFGGIELYQKNQQDTMSDFDFYTLYPDRKEGRLALAKPDGSVELFGGLINDEGVIQDPLRERDLYNILIANKIDIIHYNHLLGHPIALPEIGLALGIPSVLQVHDYYSLCREYTLIGLGDVYCGVRTDDTIKCDVCLSVRGVAPPGAQTRRRHVLSNALKNFSGIIHNSEYTKKKFQEIYPRLDLPHHVIGNTPVLEVLNQLVNLHPEDYEKDGPLRVAILGNFTRQKGGDVLIQMFWQMKRDPIEFVIVGRVDDDLKPGLEAGRFPNVKVIGQYDSTSLPKILSEFDISIHFSIWPETYCISLDEGRAAGLVPIVVGLGALAERVQHNVNGIVIQPDDPYLLIPELRRLVANRARLDELKVDKLGFVKAHGVHFDKMSAIYNEIFDHGYFADKQAPVLDSRTLKLSDIGKRYNSNNWKEDTIVWDTNLDNLRPFVADAEKSLRLQKGNARKQDVLKDIERSPLFGNAEIALRMDEVLCAFDQELRIFAQSATSQIVLGVRLPKGYAAIPVSILLVNENTILEFALSNGSTLSQPTSVEFAALADTSRLSGVYSIYYMFLIAGQYRYCTTKASICFGASIAQSDLKVVNAGNMAVRKPAFTRLVNSVFFKKRSIQAHIDGIDGEPYTHGSSVRKSRSQNATVSIDGWIVPAGNGATFELLFTELRSRSNNILFPAAMKERVDVAEHFNEPAFIRCGFSVLLQIGEIPEGKYSVALNARDYAGENHNFVLFDLLVMP